MLRTFKLMLSALSLGTVGLVAAASIGIVSPISPALAQAGADQAPQQVALTQKQIDGLIASQAEMNSAQPSQAGQSDQADPKLQAKMEAIAKKNGFAGLDEFGAVTESIGIVMAGIDPQTKSYVGPAKVIKNQIAQVQADKTMSSKDKAEAMKELKEAMAAGEATKPLPANIGLVSKNFDKLTQVFQGAGGE